MSISESRNFGYLHTQNKEELQGKIISAIPSLRKPVTRTVDNIGRFGQGGLIAIAASLAQAPEVIDERGELQAVFCELNGWEPVHFRANRDHVTFAQLPRGASDEAVKEYKTTAAAALPRGTEISLKPAIIQIIT